MTITGYQFDKMKVTPEADAMLYYDFAKKHNHVISGVGEELSATATGLNIYLNTGASVVFGRLLSVTDQEILSVQANSTGFVCQTIDLTETNTATGTPGSGDYVVANNQYRVEALSELTQQDLMKDGQIYTFPLYSFVSNGTGITLKKLFTTKNTVSTTIPVRGTLTANFVRIGNVVAVDIVRIAMGWNELGENKLTTEKVPEGFRPKGGGSLIVYRNSGSSIQNPSILYFNEAGEIRFTNGTTGTHIMTGSTSWLTEDAMPIDI